MTATKGNTLIGLIGIYIQINKLLEILKMLLSTTGLLLETLHMHAIFIK